jgi:hypothetical protein
MTASAQTAPLIATQTRSGAAAVGQALDGATAG